MAREVKNYNDQNENDVDPQLVANLNGKNDRTIRTMVANLIFL